LKKLKKSKSGVTYNYSDDQNIVVTDRRFSECRVMSRFARRANDMIAICPEAIKSVFAYLFLGLPDKPEELKVGPTCMNRAKALERQLVEERDVIDAAKAAVTSATDAVYAAKQNLKQAREENSPGREIVQLQQILKQLKARKKVEKAKWDKMVNKLIGETPPQK
jgi:hypothetical protein